MNFVFHRELLIAVLKREEELRFSKEFQEEYSLEDTCQHIEQVTNKIQGRALLENGISYQDLQSALIALRNVRYDYKNDPDLCNLSIYVRADHAKQGDLREGDKVYDIKSLVSLDNEVLSLSEWREKNQKDSSRPLVLFSGSAS